MSTQENIKTVQALFAAFNRGDIQTLLDNMTDDVVWEMPGPPTIPFAGRRFGRDQVREHFRIVGETTSLTASEPAHYVAEGEKVVVLGSYLGTAKKTGREVTSDFAMVFTFRNGRVAQFREYADTANLARAYDTGASGLEGKAGTP